MCWVFIFFSFLFPHASLYSVVLQYNADSGVGVGLRYICSGPLVVIDSILFLSFKCHASWVALCCRSTVFVSTPHFVQKNLSPSLPFPNQSNVIICTIRLPVFFPVRQHYQSGKVGYGGPSVVGHETWLGLGVPNGSATHCGHRSEA